MHLTASLDPTPMRKLSACAKRGGRCHLSRPKGIGFRCIPPQLVAPIRVGGVHPRDERSRRLDLSRPFFLANALRPHGCRIHIVNKSGQRSQKSFEKLQKLRKGSSCSGPILNASMVGFTLLSRSYYYLRRRSPGPPFPPDHRQAGERGAIIVLSVRCETHSVVYYRSIAQAGYPKFGDLYGQKVGFT